MQIAVEVIPNELSRAGSIVHFVEDDLDGVGICLDFGHAHLDGDVVDAIETVSEHLIATHVHDNRGRADDHLLPFDGTIDWAGDAAGGAEGRLRRPVHVRDRAERIDEGDAGARANGAPADRSS